jgi:hypothetical protein
MHYVIAASCSTGSWEQRWKCGWNQPVTGAANAGNFAGHNVVPVLIGLLIVFAIIALARSSRSRRAATSRS